MNPPLALSILFALLLAGGAALVFFSWKSSAELARRTRVVLLLLRGAFWLGLALLLLNFGEWETPTTHEQRPWVVLLDRSASMTMPDGKETRAARADAVVSVLREAARAGEIPLRVHPFDVGLQKALGEEETLPTAEGEGTQLLESLGQLLQEYGAGGTDPAGVVVISDGRQTVPERAAVFDATVLRLRARRLAAHVLPVGGGGNLPDVALSVGRRTVTGFAGQDTRIPFAVSLQGLPPQKLRVSLVRENGQVFDTRAVEVEEGKLTHGFFQLRLPPQSCRYRVEVAEVPEEIRRTNNTVSVHAQVLNSQTRVFLAEGAPYWDSKFLAQLLRQQTHMEVRSVHRLSDTRYFRIDSGSAGPVETAERAIFPETLEELMRYDLVVFGKNVDGFLTPARVELLRRYVRDGGGAVLFARGKPESGESSELAVLEPVNWARAGAAAFRLQPTAEGEAAGLFGGALPAADASLWRQLPLLQDARQVESVKPFTRVLAEGVMEGGNERFPLLMVRRHGQGVCGLLNADGVWKWDFFPEARELGNSYEDFWIQLIQWMATYSEFLPGQDFSLRLSSAEGDPGDPVTLTLGYRGELPAPAPRVAVEAGVEKLAELLPAELPDELGRPSWRVSFTPRQPGALRFRVVDPRNGAPSTPEVGYVVRAPQREVDDLSPDGVFLEKLARATQGAVLAQGTLADWARENLVKETAQEQGSTPVWKPHWERAWVALALAGLLAAEWWLRRRQGLA